MIGGTYGNRQESQIMLMLPEEKCSDEPHFKEGSCVACPIGSVFETIGKECDWCKPFEFFHEDPENYFDSECASCPAGTVGGYENECIPCEGGRIYSPSNNFAKCEKCSPNALCPLGTKF
jgi:hypothetical protein